MRTKPVTFNGTSAQYIDGNTATTFTKLTLNNSAGINLSGVDVSVSDSLVLTSGLITTGSNTVTIGSAGVISGASSTTFINGKLARVITGTSAVTFPVGKSGSYRPSSFTYASTPGTKTVTIEYFTSGSPLSLTTASTARFGAGYWNVLQSAIGINYTIGLNNGSISPLGTAVILRREASGTVASNATSFSAPTYSNAATFSTTNTSNDVMY